MPSRSDVVIAGHLGDHAVVDAGLTSDDPAVRAAALGAAARLGRLTAERLDAGLRDVDAGVRRRAVELSAERRTEPDRPDGADEVLLTLLLGSDLTLVEVAAWALGERHGLGDDGKDDGDLWTDGEVRIVTALGSVASGHGDALCREAAVAALGSIGHPDGRSIVLGAMLDKATVRRRAVLALARYEGPEVEAALAEARQDRDWQVRQAAEDLSG